MESNEFAALKLPLHEADSFTSLDSNLGPELNNEAQLSKSNVQLVASTRVSGPCAVDLVGMKRILKIDLTISNALFARRKTFT